MGDLAGAGFRFDNSYRRDLPGAWLDQAPRRVPAPRLLAFNRALAADLGLDPDLLESDAAEVFSGNRLPRGPSRWHRPMPGISSAAFPRNWATGGHCFWANRSIRRGGGATSR